MEVKDTSAMRQLWQEASTDKTPGTPADQVLDRLELKYQALVDAADSGKIATP